MDTEGGIGKDNKLMWHIPGELPRFKKITTGHAVIMGRKTWESLPFKPLPNRTNIIITRDFSYMPTGAIVCNSIEDAINKAKETEKSEIFVIGGGQIYQQALPFADKLYLTLVDGTFDADTYFPDYSDFKKVISEELHEDGGYRYKFIELER